MNKRCRDQDLCRAVQLVLNFSFMRYQCTEEQFDQFPPIKQFIMDEEQQMWLQEFCELLLDVQIDDESPPSKDASLNSYMMSVKDMVQFAELVKTLYKEFDATKNSLEGDSMEKR